MKNTKVYLMSTENVKDPRTFALWKEFLPKEHWEKTVRPLKEEDRKTELAAWFLLYQALREWGISEEKIKKDDFQSYDLVQKKKSMQTVRIIMENMANRCEEMKKSVLIFLILGNMYCVQYQKWKLAVILKR